MPPAPTRKHLLTAAVGDPADLVALLVARLRLSPAVAAALIERGAVEIDRVRATRRTTVRLGARVIVRAPADVAADEATAADAPLRIVYRDDQLIVVDKPAGMLSQPSPGESATSLAVRLRDIDARATLVHRIDRETSGLVLAALDGPTTATLARALEEGLVTRQYRARVVGRLVQPRELRMRIARHATDERKRIALPEGAPGGQAATTTVRPLSVDGDLSLVAAELATGRTHQIRVHLAASGHPIVGDSLYGGPAAPRLLLHAHRLQLAHPTTGAPLSLEAPLPDELR